MGSITDTWRALEAAKAAYHAAIAEKIKPGMTVHLEVYNPDPSATRTPSYLPVVVQKVHGDYVYVSGKPAVGQMGIYAFKLREWKE